MPEEEGDTPHAGSRQGLEVTLILIPLLIVCIWCIENRLLMGTTLAGGPIGMTELILYTVLSCIVVGILVPVVRIRAAFIAGVTNLFQIGFRTLRRTIAAVSLTALAVYTVVLFLQLAGSGPDRSTAIFLFALVVPTAIAAVMICWGFAGTHIQAYVRNAGILVSITVGVVFTALIYAISMSVLFMGVTLSGTFGGFFAAGIIAALFFFAVRDIYATILVVASSLVLILAPYPGISSQDSLILPVILCALISVVTLVAVHWHFSRHYTTIMIPKT